MRNYAPESATYDATKEAMLRKAIADLMEAVGILNNEVRSLTERVSHLEKGTQP